MEDVFLQKFCFWFVYRRHLMIGTKSHGYSNSGWLSEGEYSGPFFSTRPSPSKVRDPQEEHHWKVVEGSGNYFSM